MSHTCVREIASTGSWYYEPVLECMIRTEKKAMCNIEEFIAKGFAISGQLHSIFRQYITNVVGRRQGEEFFEALAEIGRALKTNLIGGF
ncbi:hypothetical protein GCM10028803_13560 [Larkinella knui]